MEKRFDYKKYLYAAAIVVVIGAAAVNGYYLGTRHPQTVIVKGVDNIQGGEIANADLAVFWQTWDLLKNNYLKADKVGNQDLIYGATEGLVKALGDPYTVFMTPQDAKKFNDDINGSFGGIGAEIGVKGDYIVVVAPLKNTPAEKAGLKSGDKILAVNATSTANMSVDEAVKLIRGPKGSEVTLTVLSNGDEKPKDVKIIRATITVPTLEWKIIDGKIVHVQLYNFNESAPFLFVKALNQALNQGAEGIILDLRSNPGGYLEIAVNLAGWFVDRGATVVSEEFASGERLTFEARGNPMLKDVPLVVLVDKGSASASEILAGALRDLMGATLVGETTFGKGTVQELKELPDGSTLKVTVAHWVLPKGGVIDGEGIKPDVEVKLTDEDIENDKDPQLDKAVEILKTKI